MAHFRLQRGKWRAEIARQGIRRSATFETMEEAAEWARLQERTALKRAKLNELRKNEALASILPKAVMWAQEQIGYSAEEILEGAIPSPMASGIYFLIKDWEIVYVGQSLDVHHRIARHRRDKRIEFDSYNVVFCPPEQLDDMERAYIRAFVPWRNISM